MTATADVAATVRSGASTDFLGYVARRVGYAVLVVWLAYTISFALLWLLPSNPVEMMLLRGDSTATPEQIAAVEHQYGLDQNVLVQYASMMGRALRGDLGTSITSGRPVATMLVEDSIPTFVLGGASLLFAVVVGIGIALLANATRWRPLKTFLYSLPPFLSSIPTFWSGLILIQVFAFGLHWFPAVGGRGLNGLILPTVTLGLALSAAIAQIAARAMEESVESAYGEQLRARGVSRGRILVRHALRNALIPVTTLVGVYVGAIFAGAVITETVFSRPGLGRVLQQAVEEQDIPVVQGVVIVCAVSFAFFNLVVDLLYPLIDPRISTR